MGASEPIPFNRLPEHVQRALWEPNPDPAWFPTWWEIRTVPLDAVPRPLTGDGAAWVEYVRQGYALSPIVLDTDLRPLVGADYVAAYAEAGLPSVRAFVRIADPEAPPSLTPPER